MHLKNICQVSDTFNVDDMGPGLHRWWRSVCVCAYVVCAMSLCLSLCVCWQRLMLGLLLDYTSYFWDRISYWLIWSLLFWLDQLASEPQGSACLCFPLLPEDSSFLCVWMLEIWTQVSFLRSKFFNNWAISTSPSIKGFWRRVKQGKNTFLQQQDTIFNQWEMKNYGIGDKNKTGKKNHLKGIMGKRPKNPRSPPSDGRTSVAFYERWHLLLRGLHLFNYLPGKMGMDMWRGHHGTARIKQPHDLYPQPWLLSLCCCYWQGKICRYNFADMQVYFCNRENMQDVPDPITPPL